MQRKSKVLLSTNLMLLSFAMTGSKATNWEMENTKIQGDNLSKYFESSIGRLYHSRCRFCTVWFYIIKRSFQIILTYLYKFLGIFFGYHILFNTGKDK